MFDLVSAVPLDWLVLDPMMAAGVSPQQVAGASFIKMIQLVGRAWVIARVLTYLDGMVVVVVVVYGMQGPACRTPGQQPTTRTYRAMPPLLSTVASHRAALRDVVCVCALSTASTSLPSCLPASRPARLPACLSAMHRSGCTGCLSSSTCWTTAWP